MMSDSLDIQASRLRSPRSTLFGRESEVVAVQALLRDPNVRLLTLTGPGGVGKSRLAAEVARNIGPEIRDGVAFVPLASISDAALVALTVAEAVGVQELSGQPLHVTLAAELTRREALIVLDNFEHVEVAAPLLADLLAASPGLRLLVTSRSVLRLSGEFHFPVLPLEVPATVPLPSLTELERVASVRLFVDRARSATGVFSLTRENASEVAGICSRLDGLPLAIELAASWTRVLSPTALLERLAARLLDLGTGPRDAPARQQTIRDTIAWSYDLLSGEDRTLLARLSVFSGGWTIESAQAIGGPETGDVLDGLARLIDQSLVHRVSGSNQELRFDMLGTIREYARNQLVLSDEMESVARRHSDHFLTLVEQARDELVGPHQSTWFALLAIELDNLRAVFERALDKRDAGLALRVGSALWRFWAQRGHLSEGRTALERALAIESNVDDSLRGRAFYYLGNLALDLNEFETARRHFEESLSIQQWLDDQDGIASALNGLALVARELGEFAEARDQHYEALLIWQAIGDERGIAIAEHNLGRVAAAEGSYEEARAYYERALALRRQLEDPGGVGYSLWVLGNVALLMHDERAAEAHYQESIAIFRDLGDRQGEAYIQHGLARLAAQSGNDVYALRLFRDVIVLRQSLGERNEMVESIEIIAALLIKRGHLVRGVKLLGAAAALRESISLAPTKAERYEQEQVLALARRALPNGVFADVWTGGQRMSLEQATEEALAATEEEAIVTRPEAPFNLTQREQEVLTLLCRHLTDAEIAKELYISIRTASNHVASIISKLGVKNRREVIALSSRHGLV